MPSTPTKTFSPTPPMTKKRHEYNTLDNLRFYNSKLWRTLSSAHKDQYPLCYECVKLGQYTGADITDHTIPIIHGGARLDRRNLGALCHKHHNSKSSREKRQPIYKYEVLPSGEKIPVRDANDELILNGGNKN